MIDSNKSGINSGDMNLDLNKNFGSPNSNSLNFNQNIKGASKFSSSEFNVNDNKKELINFGSDISKISKQEESIQKGIDTSTKMNSGQPGHQIQHQVTIFTSSKIESFKQRLLKEINNARENPKSFIPKIKNLMNSIIVKSDSIYLKVDFKTNIKLLTGKKAFENCLRFLGKQEPLHPLFLKDELTFDFSFDSPIDCDNQVFLTSVLTKKNQEIKKEDMEIVNFHYDITIPNPELSVLLQIIDDTNSKYQRRQNIFNESASYIGISIGKKAEGVICFYLLFARDLQ